MDEEVALDYLDKAAELERLERIQRCDGNQLEFALEYFSESRNSGNPGNWDGFDITSVADAPAFHRDISDIMNALSNEEVNGYVAAAAPRSHGKSTYLSKAFPISEIAYRKRKYAIIISETPTVSKANMEWIRNQLKFNEKLRADFGPLLSPNDQANIVDNGEAFIAWHKDGDSRKQVSLVQAASTGQALRGRNWNGTRPDLIICDDLEDARPGGNASTHEQRTKLRDWFTQTVMPLGDPKGEKTAFVVMGTTTHFESLLMHLLHDRSDFKTKVYRAIEQEPVNAGLWEQCRKIYIDKKNPDRASDANRFYADNEAQLLEGSRVLWPEVQPLLKLMKWKWDNGTKAFNTEYMNNPVDEDSIIFNPETFKYEAPTDLSSGKYVVGLSVDFATGKQNGDYSAIVVAARHRENGIIYVVDTFIERVKIDVLFDEVVTKVTQWQPSVVAADANAMQEVISGNLERRLQAEGYPASTRLKHVKNRSNKFLRIEAMKPDIENETIRFDRQHSRLLEQFERYDGRGGFFDDGPDAMQMAVDAVKKVKLRKASTVGTLR